MLLHNSSSESTLGEPLEIVEIIHHLHSMAYHVSPTWIPEVLFYIAANGLPCGSHFEIEGIEHIMPFDGSPYLTSMKIGGARAHLIR